MMIQTELTNSFKKNKERIAIEYDDKQVSYSELSAKSDNIRNYILNENLVKETLIGIYIDDRLSFIYSMIGVLKAGCTFVPIDITMPDKRFEIIIKDLNLKHIIVSRRLYQEIHEKHDSLEYIIYEDIIEDNISTSKEKLQQLQFNDDDSIYVYYTSGSTGIPKGIIGKNSSLVQFLQWEIKTFNISKFDRFSDFISPYFDAFLRDIFVPLLTGGTICIPPELSYQDYLVSWIDKLRISVIHCVPSLFRAFNNTSISSENFKSLKYVLLSGEKINPPELENWYAIFNERVQLVNLYGTTETTMVRSFYLISPEDVGKNKIPIGIPIEDTKLLIADDDFIPCPKLVAGNIYIISDYTSKGYLNCPKLTHETFLKINKGTPNETIAFKTGDKARVLANGDIDLIGRQDRQVKLRGIRIELDEIENIFFQTNMVKNAAVIKHVENSVESIVAFYVRKGGVASNIDINDKILEHLKQFLPQYMVPSKILELSDFPLFENGKIDYKKLPTCIYATNFKKPEDKIEEELLNIWKGILGDKPISTDDKFHIAGGDSIKIMRLLGWIYEIFNIRISLSDLYNNSTIKKQAEFIRQSNKDMAYLIKKSPIKQSYCVSLNQERLFHVCELNKASTAYNIPMAFKIQGTYDRGKIENVIKLLVQRHESLRTEFVFEGDKLVQAVKENFEFNITEYRIPDCDIEDAISKFIRPFELSKAPLIKCCILITNEDEKVLVVDIHHIVCDGMSQLILYKDFMSLYRDEKLVPLSFQYKDFAEWEYNFKKSDEYKSSRDFWLNCFKNEIPKLDLSNKEIKKEQFLEDEGGCTYFKVKSKELRPIMDEFNKEEITTFSVLFSIYFLFLSQLTDQEDIVIGIPTSGRIQKNLSNMVGMFTKTLPIRYKIDLNMQFKDFVKDVHKLLSQAISNQMYDLSDIIADINNEKQSDAKVLFNTMFTMQNFEQEKQKEGIIDFSSQGFMIKSVKFPISIIASEREDYFNFRFEYLYNSFVEDEIDSLIKKFMSIIESVSKNMDAKVLEYFNKKYVKSDFVKKDIAFNI